MSFRDLPRVPIAGAVLFALAAPPARAQLGSDWCLLHELEGSFAFGQFGMFTDGAGDVDADGVPDVLVGSFGASPPGLTDAGAVYVYSGATGALIHEWLGAAAGDELGRAVCRVGDVDNDGFDDVAGGAWGADNFGLTDIGVIYVWSGATGDPIHTIWGVDESALFGRYMRDTGDVDKDGVPDFIAGAYHAQPGGMVSAGRASVLSGATGLPIWEFDGENPGDGMGRSVAGAGDVDGDGWLDLVVGAWRTDYTDLDAGSAYVFSGQDGTLIHRFDGFAASDCFGRSVSDAGDTDGDGVPDLIVGAYLADPGGNTSAGSTYVFSGATMALLHQFDGEAPGDTLGWFVDGPGDTDGDGLGDVLVGAWQAKPGGRPRAGSCYLHSGQSGFLLFRFDGVAANDELGRSCSAVGDVDGDGVVDLVLGADTRRHGGLPAVGSAYVYGSNHGLDTDGDALSDFAEALTGTDIRDQDTDDDGLADGEECLPWGTSAVVIDTDGDLLQDGTEQAVVSGQPGNPAAGIAGTDLAVFIPDADPGQTTNPLDPDTDSGDLTDGKEDLDRNGAIDPKETDPNDPGDDHFPHTVSNLIAGRNALVAVSQCRAGETVVPLYSLTGAGPTYIAPFDFTLDLSSPIVILPGMAVAPDGTASQLVAVPPGAPSGLPVWSQPVEVVQSAFYRLSDPLVSTVQ